MSSYNEFITEDRRLVILRLLNEDKGYSLNAAILQTALEHTAAHTASRDQVIGDIDWLMDMGLVTREDIGSVVIAKLTQRGAEVATGRATVTGVKRPSPQP